MRPPIDHFGAIARFYDRLIRTPAEDSLGAELELKGDSWLLDVGGGTGRRASALSESGIDVVVCDRSMPMLFRARQKGLNVVLASADRLPFAAASVPRAMVVDAFHHFVLPDPISAQSGAAKELVRVLRPGGLALIEEPDVRNIAGRLIRWMEGVLMMGSRFLTPAALGACLVSAGRKVDRVTAAGLSYRLVLSIPEEGESSFQ